MSDRATQSTCIGAVEGPSRNGSRATRPTLVTLIQAQSARYIATFFDLADMREPLDGKS